MHRNNSRFQRWISLFALLVLIFGTGPGRPGTQPYSGDLQSVLVQGAGADQAAALVIQYGGEVTSRLEIIQGVGARIPADGLAALRKDPAGVRVTPNAQTRLTADSFDKKAGSTPETDYPDATGADLVWQKDMLGNGIGVAVLDTGIALHPALMKDTQGRPRSVVAGWVDFVDGKKVPNDPNGHGTHIAGIIANATKGPDGDYNGIAPAAQLVGVRVLDKTGTGDYEKVINGIQWVLAHRAEYNIQVMNLSLHSLVRSPYWADPLNQAVMRAWAEGIIVIVAAGNDGPTPMTISVPGNTPYVITVGAYTDNYTPLDWNDDFIAPFSSAGPTLDGFIKPDLIAPGAHMTSTMLPGSYIARTHDANWVDGLYFSMAGTSQSAAVVSGISALILSRHPELTPDQVKYRLMLTALPWIEAGETDALYSVWQQGAGRVNALDAVFAGDIDGAANTGLDVQADLSGADHFEGFSYYDEASGRFLLHHYETALGKYGSWAGKYGSWAGKYGSWAGKYGSWAGKYGSWAGEYGSWAGKYGSWAGKYGSWAGGYAAWAGKYGSWAGGFGVWAGQLTEPTFISDFVQGISPDILTSPSSIPWIEEP